MQWKSYVSHADGLLLFLPGKPPFQHERLLLLHSGNTGPGDRIFHVRTRAGADFPAGRGTPDAGRGIHGRRGLRGHAALAHLPDSIAEHRRAGPHFRSRDGGAVRPCRPALDRVRLHLRRHGARLFLRHDLPEAQRGEPSGNPGPLSGKPGPVDQPRGLHCVQRAGGGGVRGRACRHSGPDDGVERLHMGLDHLRLLFSGYHSAHPGHHGAGVPPLFRSADYHGGRHPGRDAADALCGIPAVLDAHPPHGGAAGHGPFPQPPSGVLPAVPGHVHHDCLRSRERLPRHPVPP